MKKHNLTIEELENSLMVEENEEIIDSSESRQQSLDLAEIALQQRQKYA